MSRKADHLQLAFPWFQVQSSTFPRKRIRSRIRKVRWPPRIGRKLAFKTDFDIQIGILKEIHRGLVCPQYKMADGQIAMEHQLVMSAPGPWRHPDTVTEEELNTCIARVQAFHNAAPDNDLRENAEAWGDFCQIVGYVALKSALEDERGDCAMMEITPTPPPN
jgi:hypothetical protein